MFIATRKYYMTGNGSLDYNEIKINTDEISSAIECDYDNRPYTGLVRVSMKNGDKFYTSLNLKDIK